MGYKKAMEAYKEEDLNTAKEILNSNLSIDPDNSKSLNFLGVIEYKMGNIDEALIHLNRAYSASSDPIIFDNLNTLIQHQNEEIKIEEIKNK